MTVSEQLIDELLEARRTRTPGEKFWKKAHPADILARLVKAGVTYAPKHANMKFKDLPKNIRKALEPPT